MTKSFIILTLFVLFAVGCAYIGGVAVWGALAFVLALIGFDLPLSSWVGGAILWIVFGTVRYIIQQRSKK